MASAEGGALLAGPMGVRTATFSPLAQRRTRRVVGLLLLLTAFQIRVCAAGFLDPEGMPMQPPVIPATETVIAAVGDIMAHAPVQRAADRHPLGWRGLWQEVEPLLRGADVAYANLETVMADGILANGRSAGTVPAEYDGAVFTGYPQFNAHSKLARALAESGIDIVSVANNHVLDRGAAGVDLTLTALRGAGIASVGASAKGGGGSGWGSVLHAGGLRLAWIGCTFGTNGIADHFDQVLHCYEPSARILDLVRAAAADPAVDAVVVTPHFGSEYQTVPDERQRAFARALVEAGALLVIGTHPHVVQPGEWYKASDGRTGFILYSLGNFISAQPSLETRSSVVLLVGIGRTINGDVAVAGVRLQPIFTSAMAEAVPGDVQVRPAADLSEGSPSHALMAAKFGDAPLVGRGRPLTTLADDMPGRITAENRSALYEGPARSPPGSGIPDEGGAWVSLADVAAEGPWHPRPEPDRTGEGTSLLPYAVVWPRPSPTVLAVRQPDPEGGAGVWMGATIAGDRGSDGVAPW